MVSHHKPERKEDRTFLGEFAHHAGLALHHGFIAGTYLLAMMGLVLVGYGIVNLILSLV